MPWEIKGVAGAALDASRRAFDSLGIDTWSLKFSSLDMDWFSWSAAADGPGGAGTIVPSDGQLIEVFNPAGERKFRGHVAVPQVDLASVSVTAYGPWWWMERIALSGDIIDATGATSERASYVFPTQNLMISIQSLIDRMIQVGVPIQLGAVSFMYNVPKMTLSNMSLASALAELLRWCPDAVAWFDYSGTTPVLNVTRRALMTRLTLTVGTSNIEHLRIVPRLDQEVKRVRLNYVERAAISGKPKWASQSSGVASTGRMQIVTVSGPEIADFLPKDDFESIVARTGDSATPGPGYVLLRAANIASNTKTYGKMGGIIEKVSGYVGTTWETSKWGGVGFPVVSVRKKDGSAVSTANRYLLFTSDMPDWARKLWRAVDVKITGTWGSIFQETETIRQPTAIWRAWWNVAPQKGMMWANAYSKTGTARQLRWWALPFECDGVLIDTEYPKDTTVFRPWDYDFLTPPAGLAGNLQASQDWVPWEGDIPVVGDDVSGDNRLNRKICVANSHPSHAEMDALCRAITYEGHRGRTVYTLGAPARIDTGSLVGRIRRDPQDNIVWL